MDLVEPARRIADALHASGFGDQPNRPVLALAEEVGEFVGAFRRWSGQARRSDTREHVIEELADVVITAYVTAAEWDFDLERAIQAKLDVVFTRGWREGA